MQAVREAERLIESGLKVGIEKKVMDTFPELFRSAKGNLKTGMLGRWISQSKAQEWHKIPFEKMSAADRDAIKELPDWIREPLGMQKRMRFKGSSDVPAVVKERLLNMVEKVGCGGKKSKPTAGVVVTSKIKAEADSMLETYCKHLDKVAADEGKDAPPCKRKVSTRWVNRLLLSAGYKKRVPNTAGAYLPYDDSRMIKSRKAWHFRRMERNVRLDMCLNFDQVWKAAWSRPFQVWCKGNELDLHGKRHAVQQQLEGLQAGNREWETRSRRVKGKDARADCVDGSRHSITIVTSVWGNGEAGPLCIVLPLGFISAEEQLALQEQFQPAVHFISSGRGTHFMNSDSVVDYLENVVGPSFERRRATLAERYNQSFEEEYGALLADSFTGHHTETEGYDIQRQAFSKQFRILLPEKQPGGWSAAGQPCDAFHAPESWELDEDQWYCLPLLWQQALQKGEGSVSAILISKTTGKEANKETYGKCVKRAKGDLIVNVTKGYRAFKFDIKEMMLEELLADSQVDSKQLRVVSITGRSRDIEEVRVHLNALSLQTARVLPRANLPSACKEDSNAQMGHNAQADDPCDDPELLEELSALALVECADCGAEDAAAAGAEIAAGPDGDMLDTEELEPEASDPEYLEDSGIEWKLENADKLLIIGEESSNQHGKMPEDAKPSPSSSSGKSCSFQDVPAYAFLDQVNLTQLPDVVGFGIGYHSTTNCWQVRYPAVGQASVARSFGVLKTRGYVSPCQALLECLLFVWKKHSQKNPGCHTALERVKTLQGALNVKLGFHIK
ncbi:unnamed protein product [Durusdinium trenchii]|uniref:Uncharacterized protein n=1 Tax=Durusdinium trenchii TaxID=1381693 RepID=A0ABP0NJH2_9DINO